MASSSSSSVSDLKYCPRWKYDVFLSFRGEDTRKTFTGHLYKGLENRGICTFQDDKRLEKGDSIPEELSKAIEESQVALLVFSRNYATSKWCLNELLKIMKCQKKENGQTVIPIFYDVNPSHVRKQKESFAKAFAEHESEYKDDVEGMQMVQAWRTALTTAANLNGHDIREENEADCIQQIVDQVSSKLCKASVSYLRNVVGIDTHLEKVYSLLEMEINDVRIVGIWGMGGVGKTTIARAIFDTNANQFDGACFLADIKENKGGMHSLQNILLSELLKKKDDYVNNKEDGKHMIARRLRFKKVLVVLDDIDHRDHLDNLAGDLDWFGKGSRIIATTRNKQIIGKNNAVYEMTTLLKNDAIQLFNHYAFKDEAPDEHIKKLALEVVSHANGLPLALKLWGIMLHNQDTTMWTEVVEMIQRESSPDIVQNLKISFEALQDKEKTIFLDIACFFREEEKDETIEILESYDSYAGIRLHGLIEKSLVFISENNTIQMHDLIQDMGRYVVKMQKDSGKPTRLWNVEDFEDVMVNNTGAMTVEAIWFPLLQEKLWFSKEAMKNMQNLRILCTEYLESQSENDGSIDYLSNNLRCFVWSGYPWKLLPQNFNPIRLVHLNLHNNSLHHLWNERKQLLSLRRLSLGFSRSLKRTPDFTDMPNLEYLYLSGCDSLEEVHHSLRYSRKLIELDLHGCQSLKMFPYVNVESLEYLCLQECPRLEKFPEIVGIMKPELVIEMSSSGIREIPSSIIHPQAHLTKLDLRAMSNLVSLPSNICKLKDLVKLDVSECSKLETLPEEIGGLENLEQLHAWGTLISRPPSSIVRLNKLKVLTFAIYNTSVYFVFPRVNEGLFSLEELNLRNCNLIDGRLPEDIGSLSSLKKLRLGGNNFGHLPQSIAQLGALQSLALSDCKRLTQLLDFTGMPNLEYLDLTNCRSLKEIHHSLRCSRKLIDLNLNRCVSLERFPYVNVESLKSLNLEYCSSLEKFPEILGIMKPQLVITMQLSGIREIPSSIIYLQAHLTELDLSGMKNLVSLPSIVCKLKDLVKLDVSECSKLETLPEEIGGLENLEQLHASGTLISRPPSSIIRLNKLKLLTFEKGKAENGVYFMFPQVNEGLRSLEELNLSYCNLIDEGLPEDIGSLSSLQELNLSGNDFEHLPRSIAQLGALRTLFVSDCKRLAQLPEFPQQLGLIYADWSNDSICNSLFQNMSSLQHDISVSDSLSLRVFTSWPEHMNIPSWFHHRGLTGISVSVNLPENWYVSDNFLGFAVCYSGISIADIITAHLIPLCDNETSWMTQKFSLDIYLENAMRFLLIPLAGLWDASKANGKTPNDYRCFRLYIPWYAKIGVRLLYKDEAELHTGMRRSRYEEGSSPLISNKGHSSPHSYDYSRITRLLAQERQRFMKELG